MFACLQDGGQSVRGFEQPRDATISGAREAAGGSNSRRLGVQPLRSAADGQHGKGAGGAAIIEATASENSCR